VATSEPVATCVHEDPPEPGIELLRVAEPGRCCQAATNASCVRPGIGFGSQDREAVRYRRPLRAATSASKQRDHPEQPARWPLAHRSEPSPPCRRSSPSRLLHHWPYEQMTFQATRGWRPGPPTWATRPSSSQQEVSAASADGRDKDDDRAYQSFRPGSFSSDGRCGSAHRDLRGRTRDRAGPTGSCRGGPAARPGSQPTGAGTKHGRHCGQGTLACFVSSALDTSKPYLTVQHV